MSLAAAGAGVNPPNETGRYNRRAGPALLVAPPGGENMPLSHEGETLRDRYLQTLLETARALLAGPDREVALEALAEAAGMLGDRLRHELDELRQELVD